MIKNPWTYFRRYLVSRKEWRQAKSVSELAACGVRWTAGDLGFHPSGYDQPDPETVSLLPVLSRANAAGLFTCHSQPGGRWEDHENDEWALAEQRAFVDGYLENAQVEEFRQRMVSAGMVVFVNQLHEMPMTKVNSEVVTSGRWCEPMFVGISSTAQAQLNQAAFVEVIDPLWCREHALWDTLDSWAASR